MALHIPSLVQHLETVSYVNQWKTLFAAAFGKFGYLFSVERVIDVKCENIMNMKLVDRKKTVSNQARKWYMGGDNKKLSTSYADLL